MTPELTGVSLKILPEGIDIKTLSLTGYRTRQLKQTCTCREPERLLQMSSRVRNRLATSTAVAVCMQNQDLPIVDTLDKIIKCFYPSDPS